MSEVEEKRKEIEAVMREQWDKLTKAFNTDCFYGFDRPMQGVSDVVKAAKSIKMTEQEMIDDGFTTWPRLIAECIKEKKTKDKIEHVAVGNELMTWRKALKQPAFTKWFYEGFGGIEGCKFTAWSKEWVYFPVQYDGRESVGRVPRNPCAISTEHFGGG